MSNDPSINPSLYNWNVVFVKTCDGGSWTGNRSDPVDVGGTTLYYRGRAILDAVVDALLSSPFPAASGLRRSITDATDVVIGGGSAGALGVYLNVEHYARPVDLKFKIALFVCQNAQNLY